MHPILEQKGALLAYLATWLPNAALIAALLVFSGRLTWLEALAMALPMALIYAFLCLAAWYPSRSLPLKETGLFRLIGIHLTSALLSSAVWILLGKAWVLLLVPIPALTALNDHYRDAVPLLFGVGIFLFLLSVTISYLMIAAENAREAERKSLHLRILAQEAELKALKAQIDPHFLFNSLNSISALTSIDPAGSRRMCILLSDFLRQSLGLGSKKFIAFKEEMALVSGFLAIEQIRLGPRLRVRADIPPSCESCAVPPLLLQPLVENAVRHGIMNLVEGGEIRLASERTADRLKIVVVNPQDPAKPKPRGQGIGLENVHRRLRTLYGKEARLDLRETDTEFRAELTLPAWTAGAASPLRA